MKKKVNIIILIITLVLLVLINGSFIYMNFPLFEEDFSFDNINSLIIVGVYIFIVVINLTSIIYLFLRLYSLNKELDNSNDYMELKQDKNINATFLDVNNFFNDKNILKNAWKQYEKTIRRIKINIAGEKQNKYLATLEAEFFFNENLIDNRYNHKLNNYVPQALIAIGIFGTFLGLVLGLQGLILETSETTQNSIRLLIDGVKISFLTSLYGVSNSIILTFFQKWLLGNLENKVNYLSNLINSIFPKNTQDDGVKELHFELEKQTSSLESLATNLAEVLDEKISNSMKENFGPVLEKLGDSATRLAEMSENNNRDAIMNLLENTGEIVSSATQDEINKLTSSLDGVTQRNEKLFNNLGDSVSQIEKLISNQKEIINQTNASASNVEETNLSILEISKELEGMINTLSLFSNKQQTSFNDFSSMLDNMNTYMDRQTKMNAMISATLEENLRVSNVQKDIYQDLNDTSKNLRTFNDDFSSTLNNIGKNLNEFKKLSEDINSNYVSTIDRVDIHYKEIDNSIESTTNNFNTAVNKLREEIINNLDNMNKKYNTITDKLSDFSNDSSDIINRFEKFGKVEEETQQIWTSYQASFEALNKEINSGIKDYTNAVRNRTNELLSDYDNQLGSTIQKFYDLIERLNDSLDEMNDSLYKWNEYQRSNK